MKVGKKLELLHNFLGNHWDTLLNSAVFWDAFPPGDRGRVCATLGKAECAWVESFFAYVSNVAEFAGSGMLKCGLETV